MVVTTDVIMMIANTVLIVIVCFVDVLIGGQDLRRNITRYVERGRYFVLIKKSSVDKVINRIIYQYYFVFRTYLKMVALKQLASVLEHQCCIVNINSVYG